MKKIAFARQLVKRLTTPFQQPTIPTSNDHTDGTWVDTDLYSGEMCLNTTDKRLYQRVNSDIMEINLWNYKEVDISSSQILNMGTSPIEILQALPVGEYYDYKMYIEYTHVTTAYSISGFGDLVLSYGGIYNISQVITTTNNSISITFPNVGNGKVDTNVSVNVVLTTSNGNNPTSGDGTLKVKIWYKIITFG